jgi:hypothetical protein
VTADVIGIGTKLHKSKIAWARLTRNQLENVGVFYERDAMGSRGGFVDAYYRYHVLGAWLKAKLSGLC